MNRSETIGKLAAALAKAQGEMDNADKDSVNPAFRSKYANLAAVRAAIREPLSKNGLAYVQLPRFNGEMVEVETVLMHAESGEFISDTMSIPVMKRDAHGVGSAVTYARRFSLMAVLGIAPDEDDDGNAASERSTQGQAQRQTAPPRNTEPSRGGYGPQRNNVDRIERPTEPIDDISHHMEPSQASKPAPTMPPRETGSAETIPSKAPPSVTGGSSRKTAADIPAVAPTRDPVPGKGQFSAPTKPKSAEIASRMILWLDTKRNAVEKNVTPLATVQTQFGHWLDGARATWSDMEPVDQRRVKQAKDKLAGVLGVDPGTGEVIEREDAE